MCAMARLARVVAAGVPHHITQRGNRRQQTFFSDADFSHYRGLMAAWCARLDVAIWAYCLMPNHVHLIAVPASEDGLRRAIGEAHRRYSRHVNFRQDWRGFLWQGRFASFPLDGDYLLAAARYIELNPVRAGLVSAAEDWPWSSARAHLAACDDELARAKPLLGRVGDWRTLLSLEPDEDEMELIRRHERTGRPLGDDAFVAHLEDRLGRTLRPRKPGPKPRGACAGA